MTDARLVKSPILGPNDTAARLPWPALVREIEAVAGDATVRVPERIVMPTEEQVQCCS